MAEIQNQNELFSLDAVASQLGVSRRTVRDMMRAKKLGYVRIAGGRYRVSRGDLDRFVAANRVAAKP